MIPTNFLAVLVSAVVAFVLGFLSHGPVGGKLWMKLANIQMTGNEKLSNMVPQMVWNLVANFVSAYILSVVFVFISTSSYTSGNLMMNSIIAALLVWITTNVATSIDVIWMGKSSKLWLYEVGVSLIVFVAMGLIIAAW